jgi:hypothetical protein
MRTRVLSPRIKRPGREVNHTSASGAEVKMGGGILLLLQYAFTARTGEISFLFYFSYF